MSGVFSCSGVDLRGGHTLRSWGPLGDRRRCCESRTPASVTDWLSGEGSPGGAQRGVPDDLMEMMDGHPRAGRPRQPGVPEAVPPKVLEAEVLLPVSDDSDLIGQVAAYAQRWSQLPAGREQLGILSSWYVSDRFQGTAVHVHAADHRVMERDWCVEPADQPVVRGCGIRRP